MANEFTVKSSVKLANGNCKHASQITSFRANQSVAKGPSPGAVTVATSAGNIVLTALTLPGICEITNTDGTNYVEIGISVSATFYPVLKLLPGESYIIRLSGSVAQVQARANTAPVVLQFNAFDA